MTQILFVPGSLRALALPSVATAQESINLTIVSSHPTMIPWIGMIQSHFMARIVSW